MMIFFQFKFKATCVNDAVGQVYTDRTLSCDTHELCADLHRLRTKNSNNNTVTV